MRLKDERGWEYVVIEGERVYTDRLRDRPVDLPRPHRNGSTPHLSVVVDDSDRPILSAAEIAAYQTPEVESLPFLGREGLVMAGGTNLIYSYPKVGKTELLTALVGEWVEAGRSVFYLTEEPYGNWQRRLAVHGQASVLLRMVYAWGYDVHTALRRVEEAGPYDVVVVDTLRNTVGYQEGEGDKDVARVLVPLFAATASKTVVCSYHARKMPGEGGRDISGHHALYGAFDRAIQLTPVEGADDQRKVAASGRCMYDGDVKLRYRQVEPGWFEALDGEAFLKEHVVHTLACLACGDPFPARRSDAKTCSSACRQQLKRKSELSLSVENPVTLNSPPLGNRDKCDTLNLTESDYL